MHSKAEKAPEAVDRLKSGGGEQGPKGAGEAGSHMEARQAKQQEAVREKNQDVETVRQQIREAEAHRPGPEQKADHERHVAKLHEEHARVTGQAVEARRELHKTERELTQAKVPYEVGKAFFKGMARAQISHEPVGMLKILFHRETLEVLGVHCFGYQASEIVHIGQAIMNQKGEANSIKYFVNTTFNYPTMAEAYRVAAFDGLNRLF